MDVTDRPAESLQRPTGNSLEDNYSAHDVAEAEFRDRCEALGLVVEDWGIRMPDEAAGSVTYDDAMDLKVYSRCESGLCLRALVDVKAKRSPRWMGRFNERHYEDYYDHAQEHDAPVFVFMALVDDDKGVVYDEFVMRLGDAEKYEEVYTSEGPVVNRFPDGNGAVLVKHAYRDTWVTFLNAVVKE